jgi:uncharacterized caspase-like protein
MSQSRYAVLIGNSTYPQDKALASLRCPGRDVDGLERALKAPQVGFNEVRVLKDVTHHFALKEINQVLKKAKKMDLVLIYFSGHGKLDPANRLHLCSVDTEIATLEATAIPVQSIKNFIDIAETRKVGLILDCCFSGAVGGVFAKGGVGTSSKDWRREAPTPIPTAGSRWTSSTNTSTTRCWTKAPSSR